MITVIAHFGLPCHQFEKGCRAWHSAMHFCTSRFHCATWQLYCTVFHAFISSGDRVVREAVSGKHSTMGRLLLLSVLVVIALFRPTESQVPETAVPSELIGRQYDDFFRQMVGEFGNSVRVTKTSLEYDPLWTRGFSDIGRDPSIPDFVNCPEFFVLEPMRFRYPKLTVFNAGSGNNATCKSFGMRVLSPWGRTRDDYKKSFRSLYLGFLKVQDTFAGGPATRVYLDLSYAIGYLYSVGYQYSIDLSTSTVNATASLQKACTQDISTFFCT